MRTLSMITTQGSSTIPSNADRTGRFERHYRGCKRPRPPQEDGAEIVAGADHSELPKLQVTNYVLVETLNFVAERVGQSRALDLYDRLDESVGFEFVRTTKQDDTAAIDRIRSATGLSFVDATIAAYASRKGIEYCYSFDDDFDRLDGLTRLSGAVNPYAPE